MRSSTLDSLPSGLIPENCRGAPSAVWQPPQAVPMAPSASAASARSFASVTRRAAFCMSPTCGFHRSGSVSETLWSASQVAGAFVAARSPRMSASRT